MKQWLCKWMIPVLALCAMTVSASAGTWTSIGSTGSGYTAYLIDDTVSPRATVATAFAAGTLDSAVLSGAITTVVDTQNSFRDVPVTLTANGSYYMILLEEAYAGQTSGNAFLSTAVTVSSDSIMFYNAYSGAPVAVTFQATTPPVAMPVLAISFGVRNAGQGTATDDSGDTWNIRVGDNGDNTDSAFSVDASTLTLTDGTPSSWGLTTTAWSVGGTGGMTSTALVTGADAAEVTKLNAIFPTAMISGNGSTSNNGGCTQQGSGNNAGATSTMTVTGLTPGAQYKLSVFVSRGNAWAASATQNFTLSAGASDITTTLDASRRVSGATASLNAGDNGFVCYANGNWTCATFSFTATASAVTLSSTGGSNMGGLKLTQTASPTPYTATVNADTTWDTIPWMKNGVQTLGEALPTDAICQLTITGNPTITFDAAAPAQTIAALRLTGGATFAVTGFPATPSFPKTLLTGSITGTTPTLAPVTLAGYIVTPMLSDTMFSVTGYRQNAVKTLRNDLWNYYTFDANNNASALGSASPAIAGSYVGGAGKFNNALTVTSASGGCFNANGTLKEEFQPNTNDFTFSVWVKRASSVSGETRIISRGAAMSGNSSSAEEGKAGWALRRNAAGNAILAVGVCGTRDKDATITSENTPFATLGEFVHLAWTRSGDTVTLYVNGVASGTPLTGYANKRIGVSTGDQWWREFNSGTSGNAGVGNLTSGDALDDMALWQRALTADEIAVLAAGADDLDTMIQAGDAYYATVATGDTQTWSTQAWTPSNFADGTFSTATLTFAGNTTFGFDTSVTAAKVTATGTGPVTLTTTDAANVSNIAQLDLSALTETTTVNFATGSSAVTAGANTILTQAGAGALTVAAGKKATVRGAPWTGAISGAGALVYDNIGSVTTLATPTATMTYSGNDTMVTLANTYVTAGQTITFTAGAKLVSTQTTTVADPEAGTSNAAGSMPGFRYRPNTSVTFSAGATFSMTNGYLELCWDGSVTGGAFTITGEGSCVSVRGIGGGNVYSGNVPLNISNGGVLEMGTMGLRHAGTGNLYTLAMNNGTLRALGNFGVESGIGMTLAAGSTNTIDTAAYTITYDRVISGEGSLKKTGAGTLVLGAANTYTGSTTIEAGALKVTPATAFATGGFTMASGTTLDLSSLTATLTNEVMVATGDTVSVELGNRSFEEGDHVLIAWTTEPAGTFAITNATSSTGVNLLNCIINKTSTGLVLTKSVALPPLMTADATTATWTAQTWSESVADPTKWATAVDTAIELTNTTTTAATIDVDTDVAVRAVKVVGSGDVILNSTSDKSFIALAYDFSEATGRTRVEFPMVSAPVTAGADTVLTQTGSGALTIATGKKATLTAGWTGSISNAGTLERAFAMTGNLAFPGANATNIYSKGGTGLTLPAPTAGTVMLTGTDSFNFTTINNSANAATLTIDAPVVAENLFSVGNLTLNIEEGAYISTPNFRTADGGGGRTSTINQNGGVLDVTGSTGSSTSTPLTFGHWSGTSLYNLNNGSLFGTNTTVQLGWDAGTVKLTLGSWGTSSALARFKGVRNDENKNSAAEINIRGGGRLELGSGGYVTPSNKKIILNGGTFAAYESFSSGSPLYLYAASTVEVPVDLTMTINGVIQRSAADASNEKITKTGAGTLVLGGANTFTNGVVVSAGTVKLTNAAGLGMGVTTVATDATLDITTVRPTNAFSFTTGSMLKATVNKLADNGTFTLTLADGSITPAVVLVDATEATVAVTDATISGTTLTITYDASLTADDVKGASCWYDWEFNDADGTTKTTMSNVGSAAPATFAGCDNDPTFVTEGDRRSLYAQARPWMNITYPSTWTFSTFATMPATENAILLSFGTMASPGQIALVKGAGANETKLVRTTANAAYSVLATMTVPNASTAFHLYTFIKRDARTLEIYLDNQLWLTYAFDADFNLGNGFQMGSVHGGIGNTGLLQIQNNDSVAKIDMLRIFRTALPAEAVQLLAQEFPYESLAGSYSRTVNGEEDATWEQANQWTKGTETFSEPANGAAITLNATAASALTMNLDVAMNAEGLNLSGAGAITLKRSAGAKFLEVAGMTQINTDVTNGVGAVQMLGPVKIGVGKTLTIDVSDWDFTSILSFTNRVTGPITGSDPVFVGADALPEGWTATSYSAVDGWYVAYTAPAGAVTDLLWQGSALYNGLPNETVGVWTSLDITQKPWANNPDSTDTNPYPYLDGMAVSFNSIGKSSTEAFAGSYVTVNGTVAPSAMAIGNETGTFYAFVNGTNGLIQVPNALTIGAAGAGFSVPVAMTHNLTLNGPLTIASPFGTGVTAASTNGTYNGVISGAGTLTVAGGTTLTLGAINTLTGGYVITNATVKMGRGRAFGSNGTTANSATITIQAGGVVDRNGFYDEINNFTLAGGSLVNNGATIGTGQRQMATLIVTADSTVGGTGDFGFVNQGHGASTLTLGANTLTKTDTNAFYLDNTTVTGSGTIAVNEGTLKLIAAGSVMNEGTLTVAAGATLDMGQAFTVMNATIEGAITGTAQLIVKGTLTATDALVSNVTLTDGATVNAAVTLATTNLTVAADAVVTVDVTGRVLTEGDALITWTGTAPAGNFILTGATGTWYLTKGETSLTVTATAPVITIVEPEGTPAPTTEAETYIKDQFPVESTLPRTIVVVGAGDGAGEGLDVVVDAANLLGVTPTFTQGTGDDADKTIATVDYGFKVAAIAEETTGSVSLTLEVRNGNPIATATFVLQYSEDLVNWTDVDTGTRPSFTPADGKVTGDITLTLPESGNRAFRVIVR